MRSTIKALTLRQPWASLMVAGCKRYEYRSKDYAHPRVLAIHAAAGLGARERRGLAHPDVRRCLPDVDDLPYGAIIAIGRLATTQRLTKDVAATIKRAHPGERIWGHAVKGVYALDFDAIRPLSEPVVSPAAHGLWTWRIPARMREEVDALRRELTDPLSGASWETIGWVEVEAATVGFGDAEALGPRFVADPETSGVGPVPGREQSLVVWPAMIDCPLPVEVVRRGADTVAARMCFTSDLDECEGWWVPVGGLSIPGGNARACDPYCRPAAYRLNFSMKPGRYAAEVFEYIRPRDRFRDVYGLRIRHIEDNAGPPEAPGSRRGARKAIPVYRGNSTAPNVVKELGDRYG